MGSGNMTTIEVPVPLRDRIRHNKAHPHQAYHEVIRAAFDVWERRGGWREDVRRAKPWRWP